MIVNLYFCLVLLKIKAREDFQYFLSDLNVYVIINGIIDKDDFLFMKWSELYWKFGNPYCY